VKFRSTLSVGSQVAVILVTGLPLLKASQTTVPTSPQVVITSMVGRDLFEFYCASCHGRDGKGGGRAAAALKVPPPDLTTLAQRNHGTFPAERVEAFIKGEGRLSTPAHGSSDMPVWGPIFKSLDNRNAINAARIENLVKYIDSIQAKAKA
jgi:mono/diheme cytochrome c family protein